MKKNATLDFLKAIACMLVVFVHAKLPGTAGALIDAIARCAVMLFFVISGYFSYHEDRLRVHEKTVKKAAHIAKLLSASLAFYFVWEGLLFVVRSGVRALPAYFSAHLSLQSLFRFLLLGQVSVSEPLWFLAVLLYSYLLFLLVNRLGGEQVAGIVSILLLSIGVIGQAVFHIFDLAGSEIFRTVWFYGFPVFVLSNRLHAYLARTDKKFGNKALLSGVVVGLLLTCAERLLIGGADFYLGTVIATACIFLFALENPELLSNPVVCRIGAVLSLYVYILHWAMMSVVLKCATAVRIEGTAVFAWMYPILVFVGTLAAAYVLTYVFEKTKEWRQKQRDT